MIGFLEYLDLVVGLVLGVPVVAASVWAWLRLNHCRYTVVDRRKYCVVRRHDPDAPVTDELSVVDMAVGYGRLLPWVREIAPTIIVAINRGGLMVGGTIARLLDMREPYAMNVNFDRGPQRRIQAALPARLPRNARILLVDDAFHTGDHMREATRFLKKRYPGVEVHRVVMLAMVGDRRGPEHGDFNEDRSVDFAAFHAHDRRARLPWHPKAA